MAVRLFLEPSSNQPSNTQSQPSNNQPVSPRILKSFPSLQVSLLNPGPGFNQYTKAMQNTVLKKPCEYIDCQGMVDNAISTLDVNTLAENALDKVDVNTLAENA